jgi:hypothetical protein
MIKSGRLIVITVSTGSPVRAMCSQGVQYPLNGNDDALTPPPETFYPIPGANLPFDSGTGCSIWAFPVGVQHFVPAPPGPGGQRRLPQYTKPPWSG